MKRLSKLLLASVLSVVLVTGCKMKASLEFNIDKENTNLSVIMAYDDELIDTMMMYQEDPSAVSGETQPTVTEHTDAERWAFIESGAMSSFGEVSDEYKPEKYDKDGFKGYTYSIPVGKLDDISAESAAEKVDLSTLFSGDEIKTDAVLFIKNGNTYTSNMTYTVSNDTTSMEGVSADQMAELFDFTVVFNLPSEAGANNASSVSADKKKLSYSLFESKSIDFSFTLDDGKAVAPTNAKTDSNKKEILSDKMVYIIVAAVCVLAIVVVIIIIATKGKKKNAVVDTTINTPVTPVVPTEPVTPIDPMATVAPVVTNETFAPVVDEAPVTPVMPTEPVTPAEPVVPVTPVTPVAPAEPVVPVTPVAPSEPTVPVTPSDPVMPNAPELNLNNGPVDNDINNINQ